jgi:hypothetical protein
MARDVVPGTNANGLPHRAMPERCCKALVESAASDRADMRSASGNVFMGGLRPSNEEIRGAHHSIGQWPTC